MQERCLLIVNSFGNAHDNRAGMFGSENELRTGTRCFPLQFILPITLISLIRTTQLVDVYSPIAHKCVRRRNGATSICPVDRSDLELGARPHLGSEGRAQPQCALAKVAA